MRRTVTDGEDARFALISRAHATLQFIRAFEGTDHLLAVQAFLGNCDDLSGWDVESDSEFADWALKATEQEIIAEALRRALGAP